MAFPPGSDQHPLAVVFAPRKNSRFRRIEIQPGGRVNRARTVSPSTTSIARLDRLPIAGAARTVSTSIARSMIQALSTIAE
jgi:hypothetical protein